MKFQVGDKVIILHSDEEGEVIDIINDKMVIVEVRGVKFPAYIDQLDFPYFKRFTQKKLFPQKKQKQYIDDVRKEKQVPHKKVDGVWLSFLPVIDVDEFGDDGQQEAHPEQGEGSIRRSHRLVTLPQQENEQGGHPRQDQERHRYQQPHQAQYGADRQRDPRQHRIGGQVPPIPELPADQGQADNIREPEQPGVLDHRGRRSIPADDRGQDPADHRDAIDRRSERGIDRPGWRFEVQVKRDPGSDGTL